MESLNPAPALGGVQRLRISHWSWLLAFAWTLAVVASLGWNLRQVENHMLEQARGELRTNFFKDLTLRQWATRHGGVYVPVTETTRPDPYTAFLPERDIITPSGRVLTLLNPATILREYYTLAEKSYGARGHLSSLRPLNPANQPDTWERSALNSLNDGESEITAIVDIDGQPYLRLIRPMVMDENCLKCHSAQGYQSGDVGGGVSVSVPLSSTHANEEYLTLAIGHGALWLFGLLGILGGARQLSRRVQERESAYEQLEEHEERIDAILASSLDAIITIDNQDRVTDWNPQAEVTFGWSRGEVIGQQLNEIIIPERFRHAHLQAMTQASKGQPSSGRRMETRALRRDGKEFPVELTVAPILHKGERGYSAFVRDITQRNETEEKIQRDYHSQKVITAVLATSLQPLPLEERLELILDQILSIPWLSLQAKGMLFLAHEERQELRLAAQRGIPDVTVQGCTTVGYGECHCGRAAQERSIIFSDHIDHLHHRIFPGMTPHGHICLPIVAENRLLGILNLYIPEGHVRQEGDIQFLATLTHALSGMLQRYQTEELLRHNAYHDALTNLPNRSLFMDRLERCLKRAQRHDDYLFAVLFLDLDRFKNINDSLGHACGDQMLVTVAERLLRCVRPSDSVARLGGDEFTLLLDDIEDSAAASRIAQRVHEELSQRFSLEGHEVFTTASIGIALYNRRTCLRPEHLLRDADTAMYRAKEHGNGQTALFDEAMHAKAVAVLTMETELRQTLERGGLEVYYQPILCADSGQIRGFEALARWPHPQHGFIPPSDFIPVAEESGLINELGLWILRAACKQMRQWQVTFPQLQLYVSVNLSAKQLLQTELLAHLEAALRDYELPPQHLCLEVTESLLLENPEATQILLHGLRKRGVRLYIDDFGTGYSSLSYLHNYPFDAVKIDRAFVSKLGNGAEHAAMVRAIIDIARNFNMEVIAEGVETIDQLHRLRQLGCRHVQGFYFSRPLPAEGALEFLHKEINGDRAGRLDKEGQQQLQLPPPGPAGDPRAPD